MMIVKEQKIDQYTSKIDVGSEYSDTTQTISGETDLDISSHNVLYNKVMELLRNLEPINIIINMQFIVYVDSYGIWSLLEMHKKAIKQGAKLIMVALSKDAKRVLDITKMSSRLNIYQTEEAAINSLSKF